MAFTTQPVAAYGHLDIRIDWPLRKLQLIPDAAKEIVLTTNPAILPPLKLIRPASTASYGPLPIGSYVLSANARDLAGAIVASGSSKVVIVANALVPAALTLENTDNPAIIGLSTLGTVPGQRVELFGSGFGYSYNRPFFIQIGGATPSNPLRISDTYCSFLVPETATNGPIFVTVGSISVESSASFRTVRSLSLVPTVNTVTKPGTASFVAVAKDVLAAAVTGALLPWAVEDATCSLCAGPEGNRRASLGGVTEGIFVTATDLGTATIRVGHRTSAVTATASLVVK